MLNARRAGRGSRLHCLLTRPAWGILVAGLALAPPAAGQKTGPGEKASTRHAAGNSGAIAQIKSLIGKYVQAADDADTNLAGKVWAQTDDVSFVNPMGRLEGWPAIETFYRKEMGEMFSDRHLNVHEIHIHVEGSMAWAEFNWDFEATYRSNGKPVTTKGMETQIYRKTASGWRLVHVHYSAAPGGK